MNPLQTDFVTPWNIFWSSITGAVPNLAGLMFLVGVAVVLRAFWLHVTDKRNGGGGHPNRLRVRLVTGALLGIPGFIMPTILTFAGSIVDLVLAVGGLLR